MAWWRRAMVYLVLAVGLLTPGWVRTGGGVPGSPRSDLWNSLWGLWSGLHLAGHTNLLDHPVGGTLVVGDPVHSVLAWPVVATVGPAVAWVLLVVGHLVLAGVCADRLARELGATDAGGWVAGVAFASAPLMLGSIHNGTSETIAWGLLPLSLWAARRAATRGGARPVALAAGALVLAGLMNPYLAVCAWIGAVAMAWGTGRRGLVGVAVAVGAASLVVLPWDAYVAAASTAPDTLIGIKDPHELGLVRRTIGAADPLSFAVPGRFYSPDFRAISRYGETFIHTTYLGWVWVAVAVVGLWRARQAPGALLVVGLIGASLSCGPVLVHGGSAVLLPGDLGIPLPYFLIEGLPGLRSLSLVYRLAALLVLAVAVYAGLAVRGRWATWVVAAGLTEVVVLSPMAGGPDFSLLPTRAPLLAIRGGPEGAVMNWPVIAGRPYLYEATIHGRPVAGALNFPENAASRAVWRGLRADDEAAIRRSGIRYLVVHDDATAGPGPQDDVVSRLERAKEPLSASPGLRVYLLW